MVDHQTSIITNIEVVTILNVGSFTSPPCEEDVIWIIKAEPVPLGPTVITFINEVLSVPED